MGCHILGLDIGSNSVGSVWIDCGTGTIQTGVSVFPAGVDESDDKRGEPKNAKRRMTRRSRITLARRAERKRALRLKLIETGLLPEDESGFRSLLDSTDPWMLRRRGLDEALTPFEFGRVLLHLAQRRGALGLKIVEDNEGEEASQTSSEDGKVKAAIGEVQEKMRKRNARTFGEFIAMVRDERVYPITTEDKRKPDHRKGPRQWRKPVRNKAASYEHCADRAMIRDEFAKLWDAQKNFGGKVSEILTDELRLALDNEQGDSRWQHKGLIFGQRRATWDLGTLGRCVLHPSERCVPHADMHASRYRVVETVNNLRIIDGINPSRPLTIEERNKIKGYLSGPLGAEKSGKRKGQPKHTVTVTDLRNLMGTSKDGWGRNSKKARFHFNIESDDNRTINTDWFSREIVHGAIGTDAWETFSDNLKEGFNRAILRYDPDKNGDADRLKTAVMKWGTLDEARADKLVAAWRGRPRLDAKRLNMGRRAVRNLLSVMDEPWPDDRSPIGYRWPTQIEARKVIAGDVDFQDATTGKPLDDITRRRYATGAKGATARDRYYMNKHVLMKDGKPVINKKTGEPLAELPPAPLISNPVVRKAIHEVRRHVVQYMLTNGQQPDEVYIELARDAKMGKIDSDRLLLRNRLRNRIRRSIIEEFGLDSRTTTQQRAAVDRVILAVQQGGICPLCGNQEEHAKITNRMAAFGEGCEVAHIIPRASGGHNGLSNIVLSHTKCNREMGRRTPRQYWSDGPGFEEGMRRVSSIYSDIKRPGPSEIRQATGEPLWSCYFNKRDDQKKIERFSLDVKDIKDFTKGQEAATRYAARQVMAYLSDSLFEGKGLPERSTGIGDEKRKRRIFAGDGLWTWRLRREWGLIFDPHEALSYSISEEEKQQRKEKNRGDHHHHAIDALVIALCSQQIRNQWEKRERAAEAKGINTADEEAMENYRRHNRLRPPAPFDYPGLSVEEAIEKFRAVAKEAVFGKDGNKPICHRPVKRKLVGALHEETLFGPVLNKSGKLTNTYTATKSILALTPNHLREPRKETEKEAIERLATRRMREKGIREKEAKKWARSVVRSPAYTPAIIDPPPGKSGIVRDRSLRFRLRECLLENGLDPDNFKTTEIKKLHESGKITQKSGVPIASVVLLRTMSDPVIIDRKKPVYGSATMITDSDPASKRAYVGGNNHHIEIRENAEGKWTGEIVTAYEAARRKLEKLKAFKEAGVPKPSVFRNLKKNDRKKWNQEQARWKPIIAQIEAAHPIVDRSDNEEKGGRFIMSLCEGEVLWMQHKKTNEVGYFVVAKLDNKQNSVSVVLVPDWDARTATERKDSSGRKIPNSKRDDFAATPNDLKNLAPSGEPHARKIHVTPLGVITLLEQD